MNARSSSRGWWARISRRFRRPAEAVAKPPLPDVTATLEQLVAEVLAFDPDEAVRTREPPLEAPAIWH